MKIEKVILGSTTNPYYLDFWPLLSKVWKVKFNIHPVLVLIHDDTSVRVTEEYGTVIYQKPIEGVPVNTQAQCSRLFYPSTEPETTWITSDIDMFPISTSYFIDTVTNISDDKFVNLNSHQLASNSICYNVAKGKTFTKILDIPNTFEEFLKHTKWWEKGHTHRPAEGLELLSWFTDEQYLNEKIGHYHHHVDNQILNNPPRPGGFCQRRLDRGSNQWRTYSSDQILNEYYLDSHVARPYSNFKEDINKLVKLILKEK